LFLVGAGLVVLLVVKPNGFGKEPRSAEAQDRNSTIS
jgi:hypothetical protein